MSGWVLWVLVVVLLMLIGLRLRARARARRREAKRRLRSGAAALVGRPAIVIERIANGEGVGCVKIDGVVWNARSVFEGQVIEPGTRVDVVEIRGATALVAD